YHGQDRSRAHRALGGRGEEALRPGRDDGRRARATGDDQRRARSLLGPAAPAPRLARVRPQPRRGRRPARRHRRELSRLRSAGRRSLRVHVYGVERLARGHEQAIALGTAEADVAADLGQADAPDQFALRRPYRDAAVADRATGVARRPYVAEDVAAHAVGSALDAVDHAIGEQLAIGYLVVRADIEGIDLALAARPRVTRPLAGADDVELLVVGREADPVGIGHLLLGDHEIDLAGGIDAIAVGRQLALAHAHAGLLAQLGIELAGGVARSAGGVRRAFIELAAIGRIGEPVAAVGMGRDIVGRVELLALVGIGQHGDRAIELVAHDAARQVLAGELAPLEVEAVAVAGVGRLANGARMAVVLYPAQLATVGHVAPRQRAAFTGPRRAFRPQGAGPQALDGAVGLAQTIERRIDRQDVGIGEIGGGRPPGA